MSTSDRTTLHCRRLYCNELQVANVIILSYNVNMHTIVLKQAILNAS